MPSQSARQSGVKGSARSTASRMSGSRSTSSCPSWYVSPSFGCRSKTSRKSTSTEPATGPRQRRHSDCHGAEMRPSATSPSPNASSPAVTSTSAPAVTAVSTDRSPCSRPLSWTSRRCPGVRSRSTTLTTKGEPSVFSDVILVEERFVLTGVLRARQRRNLSCWERRDAQLLPTRLDGLHRSFENDLETRQLLVGIVLGLVLHAVGLVTRFLHGVARRQPRFPHDLGPLHHALGTDTGRSEDVVGFGLDLGEELLALLEQPAGLAELVGQTVDGFL